MGNFIKNSKSLFKIIGGNILLGIAYSKWMKPRGIINGGVTSLAMIVNKVTDVNILYLTSGITILLLFASFFFLGRQNLIRSIVSSVCYNIFFSFFYTLPIRIEINLPVDFILATIFIAVGYYCCLSENSSTVGMDVIALVIHKKNPKIAIAKAIRLLNYTVLAFGLLTYGLISVVIGIIFSYFQSLLLHYLLKQKENKDLNKKERGDSNVR
ncbi:YitT family protein [Enterococcus faecalis]|uniref:YitT family protein n=1 Tax=Enterococcus TaxID=1350 RepID=UPI00157338FF|nr:MULTISPECIES: YitT family protein [Enterococcus]EGO7731772.1 YitT family protein [Enterococcus faecalis]EIQ7138443.1 YitT family protein [Enterococcus faecalis]MBO1126489.1 YitT family protein [Enterococcus faecalis]NSQ65118.1 YitT family protein [Enterococcus faecalis]